MPTHHPPSEREPPYPLTGANERVLLYAGAATLRTSHGDSATGHASLAFDWLPSPRVSFEFDSAPHHWWNRPTPKYELSFDDLDGTPSSGVLVARVSVGGAGSETSGVLRDALSLGEGPVDRMRFLVPNWPSMFGSMIQGHDGRGSWMGRISFSDAEWNVTLDTRRDHGRVIDELRASGGYATTHIGEIERRDGRNFEVEEGRAFLRSLSVFLAFVRGFWTPPILPVGVREGKTVWREWARSSPDPWRGTLPLLDDPASIREGFEGFRDRWTDERWRESVELAVSWLVEANPSDPAERSIVLAQVALELMGWLILVDDENVVSRKAWREGRGKALDDTTAEHHLRLLLNRAGIPLAIPSELRALTQVAAEEGWADGPRALVGLRNKLVHPRGRAGEIFATPVMARIELAELASWYCELALLYFCGYSGRCSSRVAHDAEFVPWAEPPSESDWDL